MKKAYVEWEDCFSIDQWMPVDQAIEQTEERLECFSIGFVVREDRSGIVLCHSYQAEGQVCGVIKIPRKMIKKRIYI